MLSVFFLSHWASKRRHLTQAIGFNTHLIPRGVYVCVYMYMC